MNESLTGRQILDPKSCRALLVYGGDDRRKILDSVKKNPDLALTALQSGDHALGLTHKGGADVLEEIVGTVGNDANAGVLLAEYLTVDRLSELLRARGDLPSAAAVVAPLATVLQAIVMELDAYDEGDDEEATTSLFILKGWAMKLKERGDYDEFLDSTIGHHQIRHLLVYAIWTEAGCPATDTFESFEDDARIEERDRHDDSHALLPSAFEDLGIDLDDAVEILRMIQAEDWRRPTSDDLIYARRAYSQRREEIERTPAIEAQDAAEEAAKALDF